MHQSPNFFSYPLNNNETRHKDLVCFCPFLSRSTCAPQEVNKEIEAMGIKVLEQYAVLGLYDFVTLLDAPNNEAVLKMSVELGSRGTVQLMTLPALSVDDFIKTLK